jgi:hypothetical protein
MPLHVQGRIFDKNVVHMKAAIEEGASAQVRQQGTGAELIGRSERAEARQTIGADRRYMNTERVASIRV